VKNMVWGMWHNDEEVTENNIDACGQTKRQQRRTHPLIIMLFLSF